VSRRTCLIALLMFLASSIPVPAWAHPSLATGFNLRTEFTTAGVPTDAAGMNPVANFFQWLNDLPFSVALREDDWPFPIIETVHILALGLSVGVILWIDLRLIGFTLKHHPVSVVVSQLEPWAKWGFLAMFLSGSLLFLSEPMKCYTATAFRLKAVMLVLAGLNVWYFHARVYPKVAEWDNAPVLPWQARMVGYVSICMWFGIIIAGRWTAYF
jgi:hypothetical protein